MFIWAAAAAAAAAADNQLQAKLICGLLDCSKLNPTVNLL